MKNILRVFCLGFTILFSSCVSDEVASTGEITGVVKDASTNQTLQGCLITLSPSGNTISTGSDGLYSFSSLLATTYSLEIIKEGYKAEKKEVSVTPGQISKVDIFLVQNRPSLSVTPETLDFGELSTTKEFYISNNSKIGSIKYSIRANADWISLSSSEGTVSTNTNKVTIIVDRSTLSTGNYEKKVVITSPENEIEIPVIVKQVEKSVAKISIGDFSDVTESSFSISGTMHSIGGVKVTSYGHCWSEHENPTIQDYKTNLGDTQEAGEFVSHINKLTAGKTYYVRAYAINSKGVSYSSEQRMITMPYINIPSVTTLSANDINKNNATLNGTITDTGGSDIIEYGFYYGTTDKTVNKQKVGNNTATSFYWKLEGLSTDQTYYFKAYAINSKGENCGDVLSFRTLKEGGSSYPEPIISTPTVTNITPYSATISVDIIVSDENPSLENGIEYSTSSSFRDAKRISGLIEDGKLTIQITDLSEDTQYYVRGYVKTKYTKEIIGYRTPFFTAKLSRTPPTKPVITDIVGNSATATSIVNIDPYDTIIEAGMECSKDYYFSGTGYKIFTGKVQEDGTLEVKVTDLYQDYMYKSAFVRAYVIYKSAGKLTSKESYFVFN